MLFRSSAGFLSMIRPPFASPPPVVNGGYGWVAGSFNLSFAAQAGGSYGVEASTNLVDWSRIWSTNASGVSVFFTDPQAWQFNRRFYRVVAP